MTYQCPDCRNEFVQPFKCATCGAQKLYDTTMNTLAANLARAEARLTEAERIIRATECQCNYIGDGEVIECRRCEWLTVSAEGGPK